MYRGRLSSEPSPRPLIVGCSGREADTEDEFSSRGIGLSRQLSRLESPQETQVTLPLEAALSTAAAAPPRAHHVRMSRISERELVHLSSFRIAPGKRSKTVGQKIFQPADSGKVGKTAPGQRFNLFSLPVLDNLYRSGVLVHNIFKRKYNPIIQWWFRLLRKTTHKDF